MIKAAPRLMRAALIAFAAAAGLAGCATSDTAPTPVNVLHTPWLALRVEQNGKQVPLTRTNVRTTEARLAPAPFTITLPVRGEDDLYQIAAYDESFILDDALYSKQANSLPPYFQPATGLADTAAGSGTLMLNKQGHHYLRGLRLGPDKTRHVFHVGGVMLPRDRNGGKRVTVPISDIRGPIYLVAWYDESGDRMLGNGEMDFIKLNIGADRSTDDRRETQ